MTSAPRQARTVRMNLWRLEWLRLIRTPRALGLAAVYLLLGLIEPIAVKYQDKLLAHVGSGIQVRLPTPTPADGLKGYVSNAAVLGLIVVVVLAAGTLSFDSRQGLATFLRTRASMRKLVLPRFAVAAASAAVAYLLGTLAAWYETDLLIGTLPAAALFAGILCVSAYLILVIAITALAASLARTTLATAGISLAILLALPILGTFRSIENWLPSSLVNAPADLAAGAHHLPHYLPALAVALAASAAAVAVAVLRLRARET